MKKNKEFTKEIKDAWLEALKSGKYVQGRGMLHNKIDNTYCCYGVLTILIGSHDLSTPVSGKAINMLVAKFGIKIADSLWKANDELKEGQPKDYSNVIPLIESLPVES